MCVGKQTHTHTHPHAHVASSAVLNLQTHTHALQRQHRSQGNEAGQPERSIVHLGNTHLASVPKVNLRNTAADSVLLITSLFNPSKASERTGSVAY